ncbi:MAG: alkane 1-monooxygenase [Luteibaculaceae bacterium]
MQKWFALKYAAVYIIPAVVLISLLTKSTQAFFAIIFVFGVLPTIEFFSKPSEENLSEAQEEMVKNDRVYDLLLYSLVPIQYFLLTVFLFVVSDSSLAFIEKIALSTAFGISCGVLGINAAHELGHRTKPHEQFMAKALLLTSLYMHFFIEHNRGHHRYVATEKDPASARYGENVYAFFIRSVVGSYTSAWRLEKERLDKKGLPWFSLQNEMLRFQLIQVFLLAVITAIFGVETALFFVFAAVLGFLLLETVNYIEHYGLQRKQKGTGYERTLPIHSWNSSHPVGRVVLLELTRHSDHHFLASRKYQTLRHFNEAPQMPTGYPGMMLIALIPPLWFNIMHKQINQFNQSLSKEPVL